MFACMSLLSHVVVNGYTQNRSTNYRGLIFRAMPCLSFHRFDFTFEGPLVAFSLLMFYFTKCYLWYFHHLNRLLTDIFILHCSSSIILGNMDLHIYVFSKLRLVILGLIVQKYFHFTHKQPNVAFSLFC